MRRYFLAPYSSSYTYNYLAEDAQSGDGTPLMGSEHGSRSFHALSKSLRISKQVYEYIDESESLVHLAAPGACSAKITL